MLANLLSRVFGRVDWQVTESVISRTEVPDWVLGEDEGEPEPLVLTIC